MTRPVFVDTVYILALANPRDRWHARAVEAARRAQTPALTTEAVLTEVADALSAHDRRARAVRILEALRSDPQIETVPVDAGLFARGLDLYAKRHDKDWSLTDCISFVVMRERKMEAALSADRHFEQAGFRALLLEGP